MSRFGALLEEYEMQHSKFMEGYTEWITSLTQMERTVNNRFIKTDPSLFEYYPIFCEKYPLNISSWIRYANFVSDEHGRDEALKIYQLAVTINPKSLDLWVNFTTWATQHFLSDNRAFVEGLFIQALGETRYDFHCSKLLEGYLNIVRDSLEKTIEIYNYIMHFPFKKLPETFNKAGELIYRLPPEMVIHIYQSYYAANYPSENNDPEYLRSFIHSIEKAKFESSYRILQEKEEMELDLQGFSDFDKSNDSSIIKWLVLIRNENRSKNFERIQYNFERALIIKPDSIALWKMYLNFLDSHYSKDSNEILKDIIQLRINYFYDFSSELFYKSLELLEKRDIEYCSSLFAAAADNSNATLELKTNFLFFLKRNNYKESINQKLIDYIEAFHSDCKIAPVILKNAFSISEVKQV